MKTIYLVRHGEAENNVKTPEYLGDAILTRDGEKQAAALADRASRLPIEAIVASPQKRAQQTALVISERIGTPVETSSLFVERKNPSMLEGLIWDDAETQRIEKEWVESFYTENTRVLDGENFADMSERGKQALQYLENRPESHILLVSHGIFARMLIARMWFGDALTPHEFQKIARGMRTKNTGVSVLRHDPTDRKTPWWLFVWNDHAHLG